MKRRWGASRVAALAALLAIVGGARATAVEGAFAPRQLRVEVDANSILTASLADFGSLSVPMQEVELIVGGGTAILTDALGRRLGLLDTTDVTLAEIPGGGFDPYIEPGRVGDDVADTESATSVSVSFWLKQESVATYDVRVRAMRTGTLTLDFGDDTPRRNVFRWQGVEGTEYRFTILFDPNPAARLIIQRTDAGAPRPYQLTALCGTRFRVRNRSDYQVTATWDVYGTAERGTLQLPPRPSGQEFSETVFETVARGTVRLFVGGKQVDVKAPSAGACGS